MKIRVSLFAALACGIAHASAAEPSAKRPNVVVILADDLGYGDISCDKQGAGINTPAIDRLAAEGLRCTSGYAPAATCTPTRYAMLTGEYAWRHQGTGILPGDAPLVISPSRLTLASIFKDAGYATALIGKWHLGLGDGRIDWNKPVAPGPKELGFDFSYHMPATGDRVPCVYMENGCVVNLDPADPLFVSSKKRIGDGPSGKKGSIINGIARDGWMSGGKSALWKDETKSDTFRDKAVAFILKNKDKPFFLYYAAHEPHHPQAPHERFAGTAKRNGKRGDAIMQLDDQVAKIMSTLKEAGVDDNTLVLFSSDNGCHLKNWDPVKVGPKDFRANGVYRGGKYSVFEGGLRMPFIVRWPDRIKPGAVTDEPVSLVDLPATAAVLTGRKLAPADAVDSLDILPVLTAGAKSPHAAIFYDSGKEGKDRGCTAIREGKWKLITEHQRYWADKEPETDLSSTYLFDLESDPGETTNLADKHPEIVNRLKADLAKASAAGFTRPGAEKVTVR